MLTTRLSRRQLLQSGAAATALSLTGRNSALAQPRAEALVDAPVKRSHRIQQSVSPWCYKEIPLDQLCAFSAKIGLEAIDLLQPEEYEVPRRYGLICSMGYASGAR